jgi:rod shape-determining protein MreC
LNAITATRRTLRREWTAFGTLLIISVGMMGISGTKTAQDFESAVNWGISPVEGFVNNVADTAGSYWSALTQIDRLRTQNEQLKQQNQTLQEELDRMGAISKLNDDWTQITAAAAGIPYQTKAVRVIVRDLSGVTSRTLVVDQGSDAGLVDGEVVVDAGMALVGRIQSVDATVSSVLLVSDPSSVVVGKEVTSGALGTIRGSVSGPLDMQDVEIATDQCPKLKGNPVVTAGESLPGTSDTSPYPPGLLIGTITDVKCDPNKVIQEATIEPAAHLTDATFLLVIMSYQGGFGALPSGCVGNPISSASPGATITPGPTRKPNSSASSAPTCPPGSMFATPGPTVTPSPTPKPLPTSGY